jgi:hypothetical protein
VDSAKWRVTQPMLEREIAKVKREKAEHSRGEGGAEEEDWVSVIREMPYHADAPCEYSQRYSHF